MDWGEGTIRPSAARTSSLSLLVALAVCLLAAGSARAVLVQLPSGRVAGVMPRAGVSPASIPGVRRSVRPNIADDGTLIYHGGSVVHSSAPYLIFWGPPGSFPLSTKNLMVQYFTDVAHDSGLGTNVFSVLRQYPDATGVSDYKQTFSSAQVIDDTGAYPAPDTTNCVDTAPADETTCITDAQLQSELSRLIAATPGLPTDGLTTASGLVDNAPIYFIVTPAHVNICSSASQCADTVFCAYHGSYADGANNVLYSAIPLLNALVTDTASGLNPKFCQSDGNAAVQEPNANGGDVAISYMSHEDSETITDPLGGGWWDSTSSNEVGDNCNVTGTVSPSTGQSPNAFLPTLGGSTSPTLYDQLINSNSYYTQSEWSNGTTDCRQHPSTATIIPSFTVASGNHGTGSPLSFDGSASSSAAGYSSVTWSFGDGATSFSSTATAGSPTPATASHAYTAPGIYTVTLTLVDSFGNLASTSHGVTVIGAPSASFTTSPANPLVGTAVSFNGAGSSEPNAGASISSYAWSFGDAAKGSGATTSHAYASAGIHIVTLTVTDSLGLSASVTKQIEVVSPPTAAFTFSPSAPVVGSAVTFAGASSSDPNSGGSIGSYSWSFGDGGAGSGAQAAHTFASPGSYTVKLSVTDSFGLVTSTSQVVAVAGRPTASSASLTGIARGRPKLTFVLSAGAQASSLKKIVIALPSGLSFVKKGLAKGVSVKPPGGQRIAFTAALSHGKLTITLKRAAGALKLAIAPRALTASRKLRRGVRSGKIKSVSIGLTAVDIAGTSTALSINPEV